jgi:hypothetical protein
MFLPWAIGALGLAWEAEPELSPLAPANSV